MSAGVIDQNAPHQPGSDSVKMRAVFPGHSLFLHHSHVSFVHECSRLERVIGPLASEIFAHQTAKLAIDQRHQPSRGLLAALTPIPEDPGYIGWLFVMERRFHFLLGRNLSGYAGRSESFFPAELSSAAPWVSKLFNFKCPFSEDPFRI